MEKSMVIKIAAIAAVIIVVVAACAVLVSNNDDKESAEIKASLMVRGNADGNYKIDQEDMAILDSIIAGDKELKDYPLADIDGSGEVDDKDKKILQDMLDHKEGTTIYVETLDVDGNNKTVQVTYPLRNVVTYATNMEMPVVYAGGGEYVAGYFTKSYKNAQASVSSEAVDLKGSQRQITTASWANFTKLDSDLKASGSNGIGAFLVDYSGISQITASRVSDLEAAEIPMLAYESADSSVEGATVVTLSYLFGEKTEPIGQKYAQLSDKVVSHIDSKFENVSKDKLKTYISITMYISICGPESTFGTTPATAHGIPYSEVNSDFAKKYTENTTKMDSVEALSNYSDVDCLINNRSIDWQKDGDAVNKMIVSTWEHSNSGVSSAEYYKGFEDKLVYVNNLLPGPAKLAYVAAALYGDMFSYSWAESILQECIDMGLAPLKGYTTEQIVPYFDLAKYNEAKA